MNLLVQALNLHIPRWFARRKVIELFEATAAACGGRVPELKGLPLERCLEIYAGYTREQIGERIRSGEDLHGIREALYRHARRLGEGLRKQLRLSGHEDALAAGKLLYRVIGIDFEAGVSGDVMIRSCFFSRYYDATICSVMSALDEGVAAGLTGGATLTFSRRITEGHPCCEATLTGGAA